MIGIIILKAVAAGLNLTATNMAFKPIEKAAADMEDPRVPAVANTAKGLVGFGSLIILAAIIL